MTTKVAHGDAGQRKGKAHGIMAMLTRVGTCVAAQGRAHEDKSNHGNVRLTVARLCRMKCDFVCLSKTTDNNTR